MQSDESATQPAGPAITWTTLDDRAVATARGLAMDSVEKVGNGHPGTAMSLAPASSIRLPCSIVRTPQLTARWIDSAEYACAST